MGAANTPEDLSRATIERAKDALRSGRAVGLPELLRLIQSMSSDPQGVDVAVLAGIIQKDAVILAKVLSTAQTLAYNVSGAHVTSLPQAIHMVGYGRIRTLTMSLLIAEAGGAHPNSEEHRQASAAAVCSGFLAEAIAQHFRLCDREEAFIGACLRNLGHIVMAAFMVEDYRRAKAAAASLPADPDEGWRQVFGLTPLELGRAILEREKAPDEVLRCLGDVPGETAAAEAIADMDPLLVTCGFSSRVAELGLIAGVDSESCARQMQAVAHQYRAAIPEVETRLAGALTMAGENLRDFVRGHRISSLPEASVSQFSRRAAVFSRLASERSHPVQPAPEEAPAAAAPPRAAPAPVAKAGDAHRWRAARSSFENLANAAVSSPARVIGHAVELLREGFAARDVLVFCGHGVHEDVLLTGGTGELFLNLPVDVAANATDRTVMGVCLKYRENVLVRDSADPKLSQHLPAWIRVPGAPRAFALFPLVGASRLAGFVLVGWPESRELSLDADEAAALAKFLHAQGLYYEQHAV